MHGVMCKFQLKDNKTSQTEFCHTVRLVFNLV